ncbi:MAG: three-Cys-motif partner protein TcmP [Candidatus Aenigmatarchaeota archaeon]
MKKITPTKQNWGGKWTEEKLDTFEKYVDAYLTIMNAQKRKYKGWPTTIYFDGFAGSGNRVDKNKINEIPTLDMDISEEEKKLYQGSAERVLRLEKKFDYYYFVDNDNEAIENLKQKLSDSNLIFDKCKFIHDDVNNQLVKLSEFLNSKKAALVLLDPFGMQINWASIEKLKNKRVDLWILLPSGVIINRLLDNNGELRFSDKLENFFGLSIKEIKNIFYKEAKVLNIFGDVENKIEKKYDSIQKIAEVYIKQLKSIWKYVTEKPLILYNTKNVPIYHFIFASNNEKARKIANQIIEKKNQ